MTIGLMLTFFDFRSDVRALIKAICLNHEVVVFIRAEHESKIKRFLIPGMTYRLIDEQLPGISNKIAVRTFHLLKKLPSSKQNYYLMEGFKANGLEDAKMRKRANNILQAQYYLPHFVSYDSYLNMLRYSGKTDLSGIDKMLALTDIYDDLLLARLIDEKIKTEVYVYSWDHPCKHVRFSKRVNYLVWNEEIKTDLINLQQISANTIKILGATQLGFILQYKAVPKVNQKVEKYFVFGCGIGIKSLVEDEIDTILSLADCIKKTHSDCKLIVRPYPQMHDWSPYNRLLEERIIELDSSCKKADLIITEADILSKFVTIENATAFFHLGTTLGLEACFTTCPSFIIDIDAKQTNPFTLYNFTHQYQNEKYLINNNPLNTIRSIRQLTETLSELPNNKYLASNKRIANQFTSQTFEALAKKLCES